jgi:hypothetical protein
MCSKFKIVISTAWGSFYRKLIPKLYLFVNTYASAKQDLPAGTDAASQEAPKTSAPSQSLFS